jgi:hypothetical protein
VSSVEETLAWEAQHRPRAGAAAIAAGVLTLLGNVLVFTVSVPSPDDGLVTFPEALRAAAAGERPEEDSLLVRQIAAIGDNVAILLTGTVLAALAVVLAVLALLFLDRATRARRPDAGRLPFYALLTALVLYPVGHLLFYVPQWIDAAAFSDAAERTADAARQTRVSDLGNVGAILLNLGLFALMLGLVLTSLNAMRIGLLTRLWGILGVVVGVLAVLQLDQPQFLRTVWLVFLGLTILGRSPGGAPPAWRTGRPEPWPTQQQVRERRAAAAGGDPAPAREEPREPPEAAGEPGGPDYRPGQARRKRKRRG